MNLRQTRLWTAIVTPFNADSTISYDEFEKLLRLQEKAGCGVVILGSTGEGLALSDEEKRKLVSFTAGLGLTVPVMVGIGGFDLRRTLSFLQFTEQQRIDGYLLVTPLYAKPGPNGQHAWFRTLLDTVKRPCMLYNVPSRAGCSLSCEAVVALADHPNFWAIKEASGSVEEFVAYSKAAPGVALYSGDDGMVPEFAPHGCKGLVSVASNAWPEAVARYLEKSLAGETESVIPLWPQACKSLFVTSNPVPIKALMKEKQLIACDLVRPPLSRSDLANTSGLRAADRSVESWLISEEAKRFAKAS